MCARAHTRPKVDDRCQRRWVRCRVADPQSGSIAPPMAKKNPIPPAGSEAAVSNTARQAAASAVSLSELREQADGLRRAQQMAGLAHVVTAPDGSFESWSETLPELLGLKAPEIAKSTRRWLDLIHPADREKFRSTAVAARLSVGGG